MDASGSGIVILDQTLKRLGGVVVLPGCLLKDHHLNDGAKIAYGLLLMFAWEDEKKKIGEARDVVRSLMEQMGASESKVRRFLSQLLSAKLISTIRLGSNQVNRYFIEPLSSAYPDDVEWSKMTIPKMELSEMTAPAGEQTGETVRESSEMTTPNVKRFNVNASNVNVREPNQNQQPNAQQLDLSGKQTVLERLADEMSRAGGVKYDFLHLTYRMVDELQDPRSLHFYWRCAQMLPAGVIEMTLGEVKDLEKTGRLRKTKAAAFTHIILIHARERGVQLRTKSS